MIIMVHILTILFAIASVAIIKKKRYKAVPFMSWVVFLSFIGCGITSVVVSVAPQGELFLYPLLGIIVGFIFISVALNDFYSLVRCKEEIEGVYCGYNTYYGKNGISMQSPVFAYTYDGTFYQEQTTQNMSYKLLTQNMKKGETYSIYVDPKHPAVFLLSKKIRVSSIITAAFGILFFIAGVSGLCTGGL